MNISKLRSLMDEKNLSKVRLSSMTGISDVTISNLLKEDDVIEGSYKDKRVMAIYVPRANRTERPVYRTKNPFQNTFKRNNEGDYKCTDSEVRRMFADSDDANPQDRRILTGYSMEDIDGVSLKQYRQLFATSNPSHPWLSLDDLSLLIKLGGYRKDRRNKQEGFTVAGLLMFGKIESIIDIECTPNYFPDFRENISTDVNVRWIDRICHDGTWEANLFQFYRRVFPKIASVLPKPFMLDNAVRLDETPTHIALREAFVNTLVHADYNADGNIVIEQKLNAFVFSNPGTLLISRVQYYAGGESVCRNKALQQMFMMIGSAEKAGSGVDKIIKGWKEANWRRPYILETTQPDKVTLELPLVSFLSQEVLNHLKLTYGDFIRK